MAINIDVDIPSERKPLTRRPQKHEKKRVTVGEKRIGAIRKALTEKKLGGKSGG